MRTCSVIAVSTEIFLPLPLFRRLRLLASMFVYALLPTPILSRLLFQALTFRLCTPLPSVTNCFIANTRGANFVFFYRVTSTAIRVPARYTLDLRYLSTHSTVVALAIKNMRR